MISAPETMFEVPKPIDESGSTMCGRLSLTCSWSELVQWFNLIPSSPAGKVEIPPRYNIAPTQPIIVVRTAERGGNEAMLVRWGLMPTWVKDPREFTLLINARGETVAEKPSFRSAMRHRRVLIPASGFYEWKRFGKGSNNKSQAFWVRPRQGGTVAFGGLMETWSSADGSEVDTGCIITTDTNESFAPIHHRLPLVIQPRDFERWLDCKTQEPRDVADLMKPVDNDYFEAIRISDAVNKVANSGPEVQVPLEEVDVEPEVSKDEQLSMF